MIELNNIEYCVSKKHLLEDVSLGIKPGHVTALVGPNGAGKSTLFKVATGELEPTNGSVHINGKPVPKKASRQRAQIQAVVNQSSPLNFPFPVFDVVLMGRTPHIHHRESREDIDLTWIAMHCLGIEHLAHQSYTTLSGGEQQRVHIARALAQLLNKKPDTTLKYLFLDEPTSNLDVMHQHGVFELLRSFAKEQQLGIFIVVHDLNLAAQYADTVALLKQGKLISSGSPHEVLVPHAIEEVFSLSVHVLRHPCRECPLIVPLGPSNDHKMQVSQPVQFNINN